MKKESGTGGMSSKSGGPIMAEKDPTIEKREKGKKAESDLELDKQREKQDMQFEAALRKLVKEELQKQLREATDEEPREYWAKFGKKVDDFINDTIEKCDELFKEGEDLLYNDADEKKEDKDEAYGYIAARLGFLKNAKAKLAQRFEGLRREG